MLFSFMDNSILQALVESSSRLPMTFKHPSKLLASKLLWRDLFFELLSKISSRMSLFFKHNSILQALFEALSVSILKHDSILLASKLPPRDTFFKLPSRQTAPAPTLLSFRITLNHPLPMAFKHSSMLLASQPKLKILSKDPFFKFPSKLPLRMSFKNF